MKVQMPDGQSFELDDSIAGDDELLREALCAAYPDAANATFDRKTDGVVKVVKKAGDKGGVVAELLAELLAASEQLNPAIVMQQRVTLIQRQPNTMITLLRMTGEIERAVELGRAEIGDVEKAQKVLRKAEPQAGSFIPVGF